MNENLYDEELFSEFFNGLPQALLWLQPVEDSPGHITDFILYYGNEEGLKYLQVKREMLQNVSIFDTSPMVGEMKEQIFNDMVQVYKTGRASETVEYNSNTKTSAQVLRKKFRNGILNIVSHGSNHERIIDQLETQTRELRYQKSFSNSILDASSNGVFAMEAVRDVTNKILDFHIVKINRAFTRIIGKPAAEVEGKTYLSLYPNSKTVGTFDLNCEVIETGNAVRKEIFYEGDGLNAWYDISLVKWGENGVVVTFSDITERKKTEIERDHHSRLIQTMLNASFHGKALLEPFRNDHGIVIDFKVVATNTSSEKQLGIKQSEAVGKRVSELLPGYVKNGGFYNYKEAFETGKSKRYEQHYQDDRLEAWFDIYVAPVNNGIVVSFANITERKQEALRIQQQKNLLDAVLTHSPSGISVTEVIRDEQKRVVDGRTLIANEAAVRFIGIPADEYLSKTAKEIDPAIFDSPIYKMTVNTLETGQPFNTQYYLEPSKRWLELSVAKMDDDRLINVFTDITTTKEVQLQIEHFAEKLNSVINISQAGFFLGNPVRDTSGDIVDFRFTMVNQVLASFVGKQANELIGELGSNWFTTYKKNGLFERFRDTYVSGTRQQFDVHYVGETLEVWANVVTTRIGDELLGSFTDFTPLKTLQIQLEKSVDELRGSNKNLEDFAYVSSHDLQEPLRKIHFFSDQLKKDLGPQLNENNLKKFERLQDAANRMRNLINDLLEYSKVSVKPNVYEQIKLSDVVEQVLQDLEAAIIATGAVVHVGELPQIKGDERQLSQVFQNLISNALKYRKPEVRPKVTVEARMITEKDPIFSIVSSVIKGTYHLIEVTDNGIGFEQEQSEKIFEVFQRLHGRSEYEGTGVGLAIVQKVITNHNGYIRASGRPRDGATFHIFLPA